MTLKAKIFWQGVRDIQSITIISSLFAFIIAIGCTQLQFPKIFSVYYSVIIFAGASQLAMLELMKQGAPLIVVVLTAWLINMRFLLYGAGLTFHFRKLPMLNKALLAAVSSDQAFGILSVRLAKEPNFPHRAIYYGAAAFAFWLEWQIAFVVGLYIGDFLPEDFPIDYAFPLTFLAMLIPTLVDRYILLAAVVSAVVAVLGRDIPFNLGIFLATGMGVSIAFFAEMRWLNKRSKKNDIRSGGKNNG